MNDPLAGLRDIVLPPPVGWWPLAEVWWFIIVGSIGFITWFVWFLWRNWKLDAYRREALKQLDAIERHWRDGELDNPVEAVNALLRQVAVTAYTRDRIAPLHGKAWAAFLRNNAVRVTAPDDLDDLLALAYQADVSRETEKIERLLAFAREWIRRHHQ